MQYDILSNIPESLRNFDELPDAAFVRLPTVKALFNVSAPTVWRWSRNGFLPKPYKNGPRVTTWNVGELRAVLSAR
jgi:predicted DNA-binding transcriptional regulator AlpA